ncbi:helix-turn-helix domain-containing protein [Vibrio parahaemolyticus]|uniref:helix-turn-helix domain-containing protein n=1 Tax=Vibrio parahaemolyticus TaxID=670 RepID=UPI001B81BCB4|nr:helix-turn-helix transcriptional regulator [Vibrio parahaemolyticus]MDF5078321.1 helix-turn-helix transcriptional regulator [Vibrio parahaemolyticus]MDF5414915.1 helix-turn-helix transcriptional regulator [Vibrio parahaemolyticus]MDF5425174.1 helix-turn-helix transcriptional regulator [Vibrio parahaemolyticus]HBC3389521.1 helix-turn-helix transcriptional regulator [Vibrio parahaemolyticus]HBC3861665.1 helix-turn-helix transcriptional regulator [Vibrio parahaemolyticus]
MPTIQIPKLTSYATITSLLIKQLRMFGFDFIRSGGDMEQVKAVNSYNQDEIAERLGMTKATYAKIENGDVIVNILHIGNLCSVYGITLTDFMAAVELKISQLESKGISTTHAKLPFRLDKVRWDEKLKEKTEARYNSEVKALKKNKTFAMYSDEQKLELKKKCRLAVFTEWDKKYDLGEALSIYDYEQARNSGES